MAIRVYIDGRRVQPMGGAQLEVVREIEGFASRAQFDLLVPVGGTKPKAGQHCLVRDDQQLLRNSNRFDQPNWTYTDCDLNGAYWGKLPTQVGGSGLVWQVEESATDGWLANSMRLTEYPIQAFGAPTSATENRVFAYSLFLKRESSSRTVAVKALPFAGPFSTYQLTEVSFDLSDGSYTIDAGPGVVFVDDADTNWWRLIIVDTLIPTALPADQIPEVSLFLFPGSSETVTCCWQISELDSVPTGLTWDEADFTWDTAAETWEETGEPLTGIPPYVDRRNVSANEILGVVAERKVSWFSGRNVRVRVLAVDYRIKLRATLVTDSIGPVTDEAAFDHLRTNYAPYLLKMYSGANVSGLEFDWTNRPLDQCLADVAAQSEGKFWRIHPEAYLQVAPQRLEPIHYTFGDTHNFLNWSNDPTRSTTTLSFDGGWRDLSAANMTVTKQQDVALPTGQRGQVWVAEDSSTSALQRVEAWAFGMFGPLNQEYGVVNDPAFPDAVVTASVWVRRDTVTEEVGIAVLGVTPALTYSTGEGGGYDPTTDTATGAARIVATAVDADAHEWRRLAISFRPDDAVTVSVPTIGAAVVIVCASDSTAGEAMFYNCQITYAEQPTGALPAVSRTLVTGPFAAYPERQGEWNFETGAESIGDLANSVTVQSDDAGTFRDTASDVGSIADFGEWERLITDSTMESDAACLRRAELEIARKSRPRQSATVTNWYYPDQDVGMLAVIAQPHLLDDEAIGQVVQVYRLQYRNRKAQSVTVTCAPFSDDKVVRALQRQN